MKLSLDQMREKIGGAQALLDEVHDGLADLAAASPYTVVADESLPPARLPDAAGTLNAPGAAVPHEEGGTAPVDRSPAAAGAVPAAGRTGAPSRPLTVAVIVGHEPTAPGAMHPESRESEYVYNSRLAPLIRDRVEDWSEGHVRVVILHRHPEGYGKLPGKVNATRADCAIELHANAANGQASGTEMICLPDSGEANRLGRALQARIVAALGLPDRGVKGPWAGRGETLLRGTRMPCVIAEPFFIDHDGDYRRAVARESRLAEAYAQGILDHAADLYQRGVWR